MKLTYLSCCLYCAPSGRKDNDHRNGNTLEIVPNH